MEIRGKLEYSAKVLLGGLLRPKVYMYKEVPIFMFHRVLDDVNANLLDKNIIIKKENFSNIIRTIKKNFKIICLKDLVDGKIVNHNCCVITFDDGWIDNFKIAFPILRENNIKATIFLPTGIIGTSKSFWFQHLESIINGSARDDKNLLGLVGTLRNYKIVNDEKINNKEILYKVAVANLKKLHPFKIEEIIGDLKQKYMINTNVAENRTLLNWEEAEIMSNEGISFGSHGVTHSILTNLESVEKRYEIIESKRELLTKNINYVNCLSFPNGNYDQQVLDIAAEANYSLVFSASIKRNGEGTSPILVKRINVADFAASNKNFFYFNLFMAKIKGGFYKIENKGAF